MIRSTPLRIACLVVALPALWAVADSAPPVTLEIKDYATMPITGLLDGKGQTDGMLARVNSLREEPGGAAEDVHPERFEALLGVVGSDGRAPLPHAAATNAAIMTATTSGIPRR